MAILRKVNLGQIYSEDFSSIEFIWDINNKDMIEKLVNGVSIKHGPERTHMIMNAPTGDYVLQANINHSPTSLSDVGGVLVLADKHNYIECQTYYNYIEGKEQYYDYIKVIRENDRLTFRGYRSKDDKWEMIGGATLIDATKIGFFLDGNESPTSIPFEIKSVEIYRSNMVTFMTVPNNNKIIIYNNLGDKYYESEYIKDEKYHYISVDKDVLPLKGYRIETVSNEGTITGEINNIDIYGGDMYSCLLSFKYFLDGNEIDENQIQDIGRVDVFGKEHELTIISKEASTLKNIKIKVVAYSENTRGEQFAYVSLRKDDGSYTEFSKEIIVESVTPNQRIELKVFVDRDKNNNGPFYSKYYKFKIIVE